MQSSEVKIRLVERKKFKKGPRYGAEDAVIDVETTGVGNKDRIVEVAVVVLNENLKIIDEYDTLVDPLRDVGPVDIHGFSPSMLTNTQGRGQNPRSVLRSIGGFEELHGHKKKH
ncbi:exonuclease domain-containing protein [Thalassoglobus sp.]|uniref:3'-5' exonuclease n=1 Tax=Thalassoglobus sp. TaxID=2795869 RepID=UPI003AA9186B